MGKRRKPYSERSDSEKILSNWRKTLSLFTRREYSVSIIRAATTVELAANLVIRAELVKKRNLSVSFVDSLMIWANGLMGKVDKIILKILVGQERQIFASLTGDIQKLNKSRNFIVHQGRFARKKTARQNIGRAFKIVGGFSEEYESGLKNRMMEIYQEKLKKSINEIRDEK